MEFGHGKDVDLARAWGVGGRGIKSELKKQNARAKGLYHRLYTQGEPGCLLADEVGKGKTYVALAVAFACLTTRPKSRVLILTHSSSMAKTWRDRWGQMRMCAGGRFGDCWNSLDWLGRIYPSLEALSVDAKERKLPRISFASYETLKRFASRKEAAAHLMGALRRCKRFAGIQINRSEGNRLIKDVLDCDLRGVKPKRCPDTVARKILRLLDSRERRWRDGASDDIRQELDHLQGRSFLKGCPRFDLLIVDEAHKLEGEARHRVVESLFAKRFHKCLLVTATPFALSVRQFQNRLLDINHAWGLSDRFKEEIENLPFSDLQDAVGARTDFADKSKFEGELRRWMIRDTWNHQKERSIEKWSSEVEPEALLPTLLLERVIDSVLKSGQRTHIASRRESLCSSWHAARESLKKTPLKGVDIRWSDAFSAVVSKTSADWDPKLTCTAERLAGLVAEGVKVVVFTQRVETSKALARLLKRNPCVAGLEEELKKRADRFRRHVGHVAEWLKLGPAHAAAVLRVMACSFDGPDPKDRNAVEVWWAKHNNHLSKPWDILEPLIGRNRRLRIVARHDGETDKAERNLKRFNLPSAPNVLIATSKAQEGIDLHHYCRHVVLFDLTWNPAAIEQRIGRVHRLGGVKKPGEKVKVIYCYRKGTYEEVMAERVQRRCDMMRVLLGAGLWLDQNREIRDLKKYEMKFPP
jgi:superfamily II DNA or RNA helicase